MPTYCTVEDVKAILQREDIFDQDTFPTEEQVNDRIEAMEDWVDNSTGHAWRERYSQSETGTEKSSPDYEYYDFPDHNMYNPSTGWPINTGHRKIRAFDASKDTLEIWDGSSWVDWLGTKTEGRANDFWVQYSSGVIYIKQAYLFHREQALRVKYRYGETYVAKNIRDACALMVASILISSEDKTMSLIDTGDPARVTYDQRASKWKSQAKQLLSSYGEMSAI